MTIKRLRLAMTLDDSGFLTLGSQHLEYRMIGPRPDAAPTLLLLHQGLGCVGMWEDFPEKLSAATGCGVFVYSRAGYGQSSPATLPRPLTFMHAEAQETLPQILDLIGFQRGLLVGHSDGGSIASIGSVRQAYDTTELRTRLGRWHADADATVHGWTDVWLKGDFRKWDLTEFLAYIRVPMLIVQGEDDEYGTVKQIEIAQQECYCPVEVALLPGARHVPQREAPQATLKVIADFIARVLAMNDWIRAA
jgi:pimeloyl-ACP methyl ester carboxylesterase